MIHCVKTRLWNKQAVHPKKFDSFAPIQYMEQAKGHLMVGGATIFRVELQAVLIMDVAVVLSAPLIRWAQCHLAPKQKFKIEVHYSMGAAWPLTLTEC